MYLRFTSNLDSKKNFVKTMYQNGAAFMYLKNKFPRTHDAKIKEKVFVGAQIRELIKT
jgi:hypothetical protein